VSLAVFHSPEEWLARFPDAAHRAVLTVGNFDGVHRGHQEILREVRDTAARSRDVSAVLTFYPHPARVLRPQQAPLLLMTLDQRLAAVEQLGIDAAFVLRFDSDLAKVNAEEFVRRYLVDTLRARAVLVGGNFRFGHRQAGDVALLKDLGTRSGFEVIVEPPVTQDGAIVSSTLIRAAVSDGRVEDASRLLGRPFALAGEIRTGTGQGRKLIVPTLNLAADNELLPANGVYATRAVVAGKTYDAATNVGLRPTFEGTRVTVESHLLDFSDDLTSGKMEVQFHSKLREERKFSGPEALRAQVLKDIEQARDYFRALVPNI
jgi:riboflavin kinase/FMN adenylyltransferase